MIFVHPDRLWLLAAWGFLILWALRARSRRRRAWKALAQRGRPPREGAVWWLIAAGLLIVAVAQPKWGRIGPAPAPGHDVILLVDVSRSMGAEDAVPDRLHVAIDYATKLVEALADSPYNRAAVVAFAGRGALRCPLTENLGAVIDSLKRLEPGCVQPGGTDLSAGLSKALEAIGEEAHAGGQSIVVLTDGEDLAGRWRGPLDRLVRREVVVHGVTIGDAERGHPVPSGRRDGKTVLHEGKSVESRRVDAALRVVAEQTKGLVIPLGLATGDPGPLYRRQIEPTARRRSLSPRAAELEDRFPLILFTAMTCLIAACWPPGRGWSWSWPIGWPRRWWRRASVAAGRAGLILFGFAMTFGAATPPPDSPPTWIERGRAAYQADRLDEALAAFEGAIKSAPGAAIPRYDAAATLFRLGRFEEAQARYAEARSLADDTLKTKIDYAMGNTAIAIGDVPSAIALYDRCIASTARGADLDTVREDAAINRAFAVRQAKNPAVPPSEGSDDSSRKDGRRRPGRSPDDREPQSGDDDPATAEGPGQDQPSSGDGRDRLRRRFRTGGAGGRRNQDPAGPSGTPEGRLEDALDDIRDARDSHRLPDEPPPATPPPDGRDW